MNNIPVSASILPISPSSLFEEGFELSDTSIIPNLNIPGNFDPNSNEVELFIYDYNLKLLSSDYDFTNWKIIEGENVLELYPIENVYEKGYDIGTLYAVYNFINLELNSSFSTPYYISDISSDRTEIRIKSNILTNSDIESSYVDLKNRLENSTYFDEFYISFGGNEYHIGVNILLDTSSSPYSILIKLYDSLPPQYNVKDTLYITTKVAESQGYKISFINEDLKFDTFNYIQGPNFNIDIQDSINNSTEFFNKSQLLKTNSSGSEFHLSNRLNKKGVNLTPYGEVIASQPDDFFNDFENFIHFSSAKRRIQNFINKVKKIESYNNDKEVLYSISNPSTEVENNIKTLNNNVKDIIENFDRYEHYLYYASSSYSYPKSGSVFPYELMHSTSSATLEWLGSDIEGSTYYGGRILEASCYDNKNQNWLFYTVPEFIRENSDNSQYIEFCNMMGQHFDELWLYIKYITKKLNTTNKLYDGVPLELAKEAIKSLGYEPQGNNYNNQYLHIGLTGEDAGSFVPSTGNEIIPILNYIAVNIGYNLKYWEDYYSDDYYVERFVKEGWPHSIDDVSKEIYKRLYHNMSYLLKKKGTLSGLRQLINVWGVPSTLLRLSEFGGKSKNNINNWDFWYKRYSYALDTLLQNKYNPQASIVIPWMPLMHNKVREDKFIVPDTIQFRFKTNGPPSEEFYTQSLLVKKSNSNPSSTGFDFGIRLEYAPPTSGSYSGSNADDYKDWGRMKFYISSSAGPIESSPIYLPLFDGDWWSVMLKRNQHVSSSVSNIITDYTLHVKNKIYQQNEGNQIGFQDLVSILSVDNNLLINSSINESWNKFGTSSYDGIYLGGYISGSSVGGTILNTQDKIFLGAFQEFRYYSMPIGENIFDDYVMNPRSIEGLTSENVSSSFDILSFRADLGNELDYIFPRMYPKSEFSLDYSQTGKWIYRGEITSNLNNNQAQYFRALEPVNFSPNFYFNVTSSGNDDSTCFHETARTYIEGERNKYGYTYGHTYFYLTATEDNNPNNFYTYKVYNVSCKETGSGTCISSTPSGNYIDNYGWDVEFLSSGSNSEPFPDSSPTEQYIAGFKTGSIYNFKYEVPIPSVCDLYLYGKMVSKDYSSIHPSVSSSSPSLNIESFINPFNLSGSSSYNITLYNRGTYLESNVEDYFVSEPIVGIKNRVTNKIQVEENNNYEKVLSNLISIEQDTDELKSYTEDITNLEAVFSFQNEINDDISQTLNFDSIINILGDPKQSYTYGDRHYSGIRKLAEYYFQKYQKGNIYDYLRFIKFFDNSLFKSIKKYTPARTGVSTGILVKQHFLERNQHVLYAPRIENITIEGGISVMNNTLQIFGGPGGVVNKYNKT